MTLFHTIRSSQFLILDGSYVLIYWFKAIVEPLLFLVKNEYLGDDWNNNENIEMVIFQNLFQYIRKRWAFIKYQGKKMLQCVIHITPIPYPCFFYSSGLLLLWAPIIFLWVPSDVRSWLRSCNTDQHTRTVAHTQNHKHVKIL